MSTKRFFYLIFLIIIVVGVFLIFKRRPMIDIISKSYKDSFPLPKQPELSHSPSEEKITLKIKDKEIEVELANTPEKRALGLMFRQSLEENSGMLFVFDKEGIYPFWMKNTGIPLSIAYIDKKSVIIDILEMIPNQEVIRYSPSMPFIAALEMNQGWFLRNGINIGDTVYGIP